jgi:CRISPR system Cascade subunit CasB
MSSPNDPPFYWSRYTSGNGEWRRVGDATGAPPGADLAKLRRGLGRAPGDVPELWRFHVTMNADGRLTDSFVAEHHALTLFGLHQQSQGRPMHRGGVGLGAAMRALRDKNTGDDAGDGKPKWDRIDAVDRRFSAAATATSRHELVLHLRGLITQLRGIGQGLDYTLLYRNLARWEYPESAAEVRRRWGMQYFVDRPIKTPAVATTVEEQK